MRKFFLQILLFTALFLFPFAAYNYVTDYSGVLKDDFSYLRIEPNQHIVKMRYLTQNTDKYNAFAFGNSRVGKIDLLKINDGCRWYNMTYSEGLPAEWLADVKILLKRGVKIKRLFIGVDEGSFRTDPKSHETQFLRMPYREHEDLLVDLKYLLRIPSPFVTAEVFEEQKGFFDMYGTGRPLGEWVDERIEANIEKHINDPKFNVPYVAAGGNRVDATIAELKELKDLADSAGIETFFCFLPVHQLTYRNADKNTLFDFKRKLAAVTDYYDFSGINKITTNNYFYFETSHFRPLVGDMITARIFGGAQDDFGVLVTRGNVDEHIKKQLDELKE